MTDAVALPSNEPEHAQTPAFRSGPPTSVPSSSASSSPSLVSCLKISNVPMNPQGSLTPRLNCTCPQCTGYIPHGSTPILPQPPLPPSPRCTAQRLVLCSQHQSNPTNFYYSSFFPALLSPPHSPHVHPHHPTTVFPLQPNHHLSPSQPFPSHQSSRPLHYPQQQQRFIAPYTSPSCGPGFHCEPVHPRPLSLPSAVIHYRFPSPEQTGVALPEWLPVAQTQNAPLPQHQPSPSAQATPLQVEQQCSTTNQACLLPRLYRMDTPPSVEEVPAK